MNPRLACGLRLAGILLACAFSLWCAAPAAPTVPPAAQAAARFDARAATDAWLATVPPADKARSDAYFEGGYWLLLWDFLYTAAVLLFFLASRFSARLRDNAVRWSRRTWLQTIFYWLQFVTLAALLQFPLLVYEGFFREHRYGLSNQSFGAWLRDALIGFALAVVLGGLAVSAVLAVIRRFPRTWHLWAAAVIILFGIFGTLIAPVFLAPLFNTYTSLKDSRLKGQILSLARANGIPATDVYQVDASRQSKRVSANVSGLFGTQRITLNDNLLNRCSPQAVLSVMGHEMGHYVMHHILNGIVVSCLEVPLIFLWLRWSFNRVLVRRGLQWRLSGPADPAALPLLLLIGLAINFVLTPVDNTLTRTQEYEADIFGLDAARQPDGEAEVDLLLGEYRKLDPGPLEEFIFFDHPSGRTRIYAAMRWKQQNLCLFDSALPCTNRPVSLEPAGR